MISFQIYHELYLHCFYYLPYGIINPPYDFYPFPDLEEEGNYIQNILENKKTSTQMSLEKEEQERKELQKMIMGEEGKKSGAGAAADEDDTSQFGFGTPGETRYG